MTTTANTTERKRTTRRAARPSKLLMELAQQTLAKLGDEWTMNIESSLMSEGVTHHNIHYVMDMEKSSIITPSEIKDVIAFASVVNAFGWYVHKDYDTGNLSIEVNISTRKY